MAQLKKKLFIKTYGCQMNAYDSARMADVLAPLGFEAVDAPDQADMVILNTCHIREKASEKVFSDLGRLRPFKQAKESGGQGMIVAVAGCAAPAEGEEIMRRMPMVDIVLGPQTYHKLPEMVARAARAAEKGGRAKVLETDFPTEAKFDHLPAPRADGPSAFVSVQEGCDKFCTFCVVPYTRGAEYSRPAAQVLAEVKGLVAGGVVEVTLLGQNVNAYHGEGPDGADWSLGRLIRELAEIDGLARIRFTTSHPRDLDDDLIAAHAEVDKLMPFLHLPLQSGSDRILAAMNRGHTGADYLRLVERLKAARPDLALSSDFIVGFPGETEADFQDTLRLVREVGFVNTYSFKYSSRPGTPAAAMELQVPEPEKERRLAELQALLGAQTEAFNKACVGRTLPVLLDRQGKFPGQLLGRSPYMQPVHVMAGPELMHTIVPLVITEGQPLSLAGRLIQEKACA